MHHSWRQSQATADYVPRTMVRTIRDDPFSPKLAGPNHLSYAPRMDPFNVTTADKKYSRQMIASPFTRLHVTPTRNTSPERIRNGGLMPEAVGNSRPMSSDSFFRPNKFDDPAVKPRRMEFSHEYRVMLRPSPGAKEAYMFGTTRGGSGGEAPRAGSPLRMVAHESKCSTLPKRNPDKANKGISRKVNGGYYAI